VTFKNYAFPVESMREFVPRCLLGYRAGAAHIAQRDGAYDLGMFDLAGCQRRILAEYSRAGSTSAALPLGEPSKQGPSDSPRETG